MKSTIRVLIVGVAAGAAATQVMAKATTWFYERQLAAAMHRSLGQLYGVVAAALTRRGVPPVAAGVTAGVGGFLLVDELANGLFFTPPPQAYPVESHLRGLVGHLTFGATTGVLLAVARRLGLL
jgi:hypothetical protein